MGIDSFLIDLIMDMYEIDAKNSIYNIDEDEIDSWFLNDDGTYMSDMEYITLHPREFDSDEYIDSIHATIISEDDEDYTYEDIIKELSSKYVVMKYKDKNSKSVVEFLRNSDIDSIGNLFEENIYFARDMIRTFISHIVDNELYSNNLEEMNNNGDTILDKFKEEIKLCNIQSINEILRNVLANLYGYFVRNGCKDEDITKNIFAYFVHDFDPLGELDKMGYSTEEKEVLKMYMLKLMYLDIYEDINNESIITPTNMEEFIYQRLPGIMISQDMAPVPGDIEVLNYMLQHFMILHDNVGKRECNRKNSLKKNDELVKKYVPTFFMDELEYMKNK